MNKELYLSPSLATFEDLSDLLGAVDDYIDEHAAAIAKYEDRLGVVLRGTGGGSEAEQGAAELETGEEGEADPPERAADRRRRAPSDGSEKGWLLLEADETNLKVATGGANSTAEKQTAALFKVIESLKARLVSLEKVRKLISELPAQGFKTNQKIVVMFRDGVPRQIIPSFEVSKAYKKFRYSEQFDIQVLS